MKGKRLGLYRWLGSRISRRLDPAREQLGVAIKLGTPIWFHAASAGELEILWPLIIGAAARGDGLVVTVFSRSGLGAAGRLAVELKAVARPGSFVVGSSPSEGSWDAGLARFKPRLFVTAKYEAWPELWAGLGARGIPLTLICARARRSLAVARRVCRLLGAPVPRLRFVVSAVAHIQELQRDFPGAEIHAIGDPRWDRVAARAKARNERAESLVRAAWGPAWPRPWGILGSAWPEDLKAWTPAAAAFGGTLWVVPHSSDPRVLAEAFLIVRDWDPGAERTSRPGALERIRARAARPAGEARGPRVVFVDEHGFLSELYGAVDWAYVGGGLRSAGLHSVIEPALHGIPIAGGPSKNPGMAEVQELLDLGQFSRVEDSQDILFWLEAHTTPSTSDRMRWKTEAERRVGAAERILELL